ncbi:hypothetical protein ABEY63_25550 [Priestia aryabhattai]|uniref:CD3337/EF1877 family mobilome membrane protein n=1 Tax=Priestia aryabhattai TaxID=412384 RepID=UPI003D2A7E83
MNPTMYKRLLSVILILFIFFSHSSVSSADSIEDAAKSIDVEEKKHGPYKDKTTFYQDIDVITYDELKEIKEKEEDKDKFTLNPFTSIGNYFSEKVDDTLNSSKDMMVSTLLMMVTLIFEFNMMMTDFLITCLNAALHSDIINYLIDLSEKQVQLISGVDGNQINNGGKGIFGKLAGLVSLISIMYVVYLFGIRRAPLSALQSLLHPILAITLSITFFSNFGTILKGINDVTTELTNTVSSATAKGDVDSMGDSIQKIFVHRPYLYLQFNSGNEDKIGKKRIDSLLLSKPGSKEKRKAVKREIEEYNNSMMEPGSVIKRLIYTGLFVTVNGLLSIPVWVLAFLFLGLQVWFLLIAVLGPFVLIWSILPNQIAVMRRFGIELLYPMGLKVMVGFMALVVFTFSQLAFAIPSTVGLTGYYLSTFFQIVFFFVLFLIRKRIKSIFSATNGFVREMRNSTQIMMEPVKNGVQNTSMVVGGAIGAASGNPQLAIQGAMIGRNVGQAMTGEKDGLNTTATLVSLHDISQRNKEKEQSVQSSATGKVPNESQSTTTPVLHDTKEENTPNTNNTSTLSDTKSNENNETSIPTQNGEKKEQTQTVSSIYVPIQDLEDFKPRTNTGEEAKQEVVGSQASQDYKESKLPKQQENVKAQSLRDLNEKQSSVPTNNETPTPSEKAKPSYEVIRPYHENKVTPISKTPSTAQPMTSNENLSSQEAEEQKTEERTTQLKDASQRHNEDSNMNDHDLNNNE